MNFREKSFLAITVFFINIFIFHPVLIFANTNTIFSPASCTNGVEFRTHVEDEINNRIIGLTSNDSTKKIYTSQDFTNKVFVRNQNVWTNNGTTSLDLTGISPWNSTGGNTRAGTLITPRHIIFARHYPINVGATIVFVTNNNTTVTRTLINKVNTPLHNDITVGILDSDVPSSITHYPILTWEQILKYPTQNITSPFLVLDQEEKALIRDGQGIGSVNYMEGLTRQIGHTQPAANSSRFLFSESIIGGDSGNPGFIIIYGKPVLMFSHWGDKSGPSYSYHLQEINDALATLGGGYTASSYDLSCFGNAPTISTPLDGANFTVQENAPAGTFVATTTASDLDGDSVSYSVTSGNDDGVFSINPSSGRLTVASSTLVNFEDKNFYTLKIRATDNSSINLFSEISVNIIIQNQSETPPYITTSTLEATEGVNGRILIGNLNYIYPDSNNDSVSFELVSTNNYFDVETDGGVFIKNNVKLHYELINQHQFDVKVIGVNNLFSTSTITVNVLDAIEPPPVILSTSFNVDENKSGPFTIGNIQYQYDALPLEFRLSQENDFFSISSTTGTLYLKDGKTLDYENTNSYTLNISITDKNQLVTSGNIIININDINEVVISSGGGGGGAVVSFLQPNINTINASTSTQVISNIVSNKPAFGLQNYNRNLTLNMSGDDVKSLQQFLNKNGFAVSTTGLGSIGNETNRFGPSTRAALIRFQRANNISPANGYFGPLTRSLVNSKNNTASNNAVSTTTIIQFKPELKPALYNRNLTLNMSGDDVKSLQQFLNKNGFAVSTTGLGSIGNETNRFGPSTRAALIRFQRANNISPANGYFGPVTRGIVENLSK